MFVFRSLFGTLCALSLVSFPVAQANTTLSTLSEHKAAFSYTIENSIMKGDPNGDLRPDDSINRAEFVKVLLQARDMQENQTSSSVSQPCFPDLQKDAWYIGPVCRAKRLGILSWYPDGNFRPANTINVSEAFKVIVNTLDIPANTTQNGPWYAPYLQTLQNKQAIPAQIIRPDQKLKRKHTAEIIYRLLSANSEYLEKQIPARSLLDTTKNPIETTLGNAYHYYKEKDGSTQAYLDMAFYRMRPVIGDYKQKAGEECKLQTHCPILSKAQSAQNFLADNGTVFMAINGPYFDAYSKTVDGENYHQIGGDIIQDDEALSLYGWEKAFGSGGMITQTQNGRMRFYNPVRDFVDDVTKLANGFSNYPLLLNNGEVALGIFTTHTQTDEKLKIKSYRHAIGLSENARYLVYGRTHGDAQDLAEYMQNLGAYNAFQLDSGASQFLYFGDETKVSPGRMLPSFIGFWEK